MCLLAVFIMIRIRKFNTANVLDFLIVYVPLGQAIGRWGNFFNQEAFGTNTNLPWGMISDATSAYLKVYNPTLNPDVPVHPTFLYESIATILIFVVLLFVRKKSKLPFSTVATYFILYGVVRFFIEGLRTDSLYIGDTGLRTSQVFSAVLVVVGFGIIAVCRYLGLKRENFSNEGAVLSDDASGDKVVTEVQDSEDSVETRADSEVTQTDSGNDEAAQTGSPAADASENEDSTAWTEEENPEISDDTDRKDVSTDGGEKSNK